MQYDDWLGNCSLNRMSVISLVFSTCGTALTVMGALKVFVVFRRPDIGPEFIRNAMFLVLSALVCFWLARRLSKRTAS